MCWVTSKYGEHCYSAQSVFVLLQAYEIMLLASTPKCGPIDFSNLVANRDITSASPQKSNANLSSGHSLMATFQATANQLANRARFAYPNMSLPSISVPEGQLEVPRGKLS